jgi:hypothetical protein
VLLTGNHHITAQYVTLPYLHSIPFGDPFFIHLLSVYQFVDDSAHQSLVLLLMVLCPEDVSRVRLGKLAPHAYAHSLAPFCYCLPTNSPF